MPFHVEGSGDREREPFGRFRVTNGSVVGDNMANATHNIGKLPKTKF